MKILHIINGLNMGGAEQNLLNLRVYSSHTNTQGEAVTRVHAHAYGGVYATFTANAEAVLTAGKRDGAVVIWQIGEEEKKNDY